MSVPQRRSCRLREYLHGTARIFVVGASLLGDRDLATSLPGQHHASCPPTRTIRRTGRARVKPIFGGTIIGRATLQCCWLVGFTCAQPIYKSSVAKRRDARGPGIIILCMPL